MNLLADQTLLLYIAIIVHVKIGKFQIYVEYNYKNSVYKYLESQCMSISNSENNYCTLSHMVIMEFITPNIQSSRIVGWYIHINEDHNL